MWTSVGPWLKESLAKLEGFTDLKAAVDALDAQLAVRPTLIPYPKR